MESINISEMKLRLIWTKNQSLHNDKNVKKGAVGFYIKFLRIYNEAGLHKMLILVMLIASPGLQPNFPENCVGITIRLVTFAYDGFETYFM